MPEGYIFAPFLTVSITTVIIYKLVQAKQKTARANLETES